MSRGRKLPSTVYAFYADGTPPNIAAGIADGTRLTATPDPQEPHRWLVELSGTVSDPDLSGTSEPGSGVRSDSVRIALLTLGGAVTGLGEQAASVTGDVWSVKYPFYGTLPTGWFTLRVTAEDQIGNSTGPVDLITLYVDGAAPRASLDTRALPQDDEFLNPGHTLAGDVSESPYLPGAVVNLRLEETGGTTFFDSSGAGNHGACTTCPTLGQPGAFGAAPQFSSGSYITLGEPGDEADLPEGRAPRSMCAWAKTDTSVGWSWVGSYGNTGEGKLFAIVRSGSDLFGDPYAGSELIARDFWQVGQWQHVCLTYDGTTVRLYGDGVELGAADKDWNLDNLFGQALVGWGVNQIAGEQWQGQIDEFQIFGRALSADEVLALAQPKVAGVDQVEIAFTPTSNGLYNEIPPDGQVFYLPLEDQFNQDGDLILSDVGGRHLHGSCHGESCPTPGVDAHLGNGLSFDGLDDVVSIPDHGILDLNANQDFAISLWVRPEADQELSGRTNNLVYKSRDVFRYPYAINYSSQPGNYGKIIALRRDGTSTSYIISDRAINDGRFHHVAFVKQGSTLSVYIDAELAGTTTDASSGDTANTSDLYLGGGATPFTGVIDDVRIFNQGLSPDEVKALYQGAEPLLLLPFDSPGILGGADLYDASGWKRQATLEPRCRRLTLEEADFGSMDESASSVYVQIDGATVWEYDNILADAELDVHTSQTFCGDLDSKQWRVDVWEKDAPYGADDYLGTINVPAVATGHGSHLFSQHGNNVTLQWIVERVAEGGKSAPGQVGPYALELDGADDFVSLPPQVLNDQRVGTIAAWVYLDDNTGEAIFVKQRPGVGYYGMLCVGCRAGGSGDPGRVYFQARGNSYELSSNATMQTGRWYHVAVTFDDQEARVYIDGNLDNTRTGDFTIPDDVDSTVLTSLGVWRTGSGAMYYLDGKLDDARIYPRALSAAEIKGLALAGWQPTTLAQSGSGVGGTTWNISPPTGLEGDYRIDLRGGDTEGLLDNNGLNQWTGGIDTLAPRITLEKYAVGDRVHYTAIAQDFNLYEPTFRTPCGVGVVTAREEFQSPWFQALAGQGGAQTRHRPYRLTASCELDADPTISEIGAYDTPGNAMGVAIAPAGETAYVADGLNGLRVIDISNPNLPKEVGHYVTSREARRVAVVGDYAYLVYGGGMIVLDISDPTNPHPPSTNTLVPGVHTQDVVVVGDYAYVASLYHTGMQIVDVSDPTNVNPLGHYYLAHAIGVDVSGDRAVVVTSNGILAVVDVSDPSDPLLLGNEYHTTGQFKDVRVSGNYAYAASDLHGLRIFDISNPADIRQVGQFDTPGYTFEVALDLPNVYLADYFRGLWVVDVTDPTDPTEVSHLDTTGTAQGVVYVDGLALVADGDHGLRVVATGVSDPTASVCDYAGNCTEVSATVLQREAARSLAPAAAPPIELALENPPMLNSTDPYTLKVAALATNYLQALTVTVSTAGAPLYANVWSGEVITDEVALYIPWTPSGDGEHLFTATARDWATNTLVVTGTIIVDTAPPTITLAESTLTAKHHLPAGALELHGVANDNLGLVDVFVTVDGETVLTIVEGEGAEPYTIADWTAEWFPTGGTVLDGSVHTATLQVVDITGHEVTVTETLTVDTVPPVLGDVAIEINDAPAQVGQVITAAVMNASVTLSPTTDGGGVSHIWYGWTKSYTETLDILTPVLPSSSPVVVADSLTVTAASDGVARYLHLVAHDAADNESRMHWGPFYHDMPKAPDYIGMHEPDGPYDRLPTHHWLGSSCTLVGVDTRIPRCSQPGQELYQEQKLYLTWDHQALRLTWTGANWNVDGDLFIYLDTVPDQMPDGGATPYERHGGNVAYNPWESTISNTVTLLPTDIWSSEPVALPEGWPGVNAMNADYALWVIDDETVHLLRWDDGLAAWVDEGSAHDDGLIYVSDNEPGIHYTDLYVPFDMVGNPQSVVWPDLGFLGIPAGMSVVALATDEDAMRIWSVVPADNPADSQLVVSNAPEPGLPHKFMLTDRYVVSLQDGDCRAPAERLLMHMFTEQGGFSYDLASDEMRLAAPRPYDEASSASTGGWDAAFDAYDDVYDDWLADDYCEFHPFEAVCRSDKPPTPLSTRELLGAYTDVSHHPLLPGQRVTYTVDYVNEEDRDVTHQTLLYTDLGGPQDVAWDDNPGQCGVYTDLLLPANSEGSFTFGGVVGSQGVATVTLDVDPPYTVDPGDTCNVTGIITGSPLLRLDVAHTPDTGPPSYLAILEPLEVLGPSDATVRGMVHDEGQVADIEIEATRGGDSLVVTCTDDTPTDGTWACEVLFSNLGLSDGDEVHLRARATDAYDQVSDWSEELVLLVDTVAPTITLDAGITDTLRSGVHIELTGSVDDNHEEDRLEVCDADGQSCAIAELIVDSSTVAQTAFTYDDVSTIPVAIDSATTCGGGELVRTFAVSDTFTIADVQVGINLYHNYRSDVKVTLESPVGTMVTLIDNSDNVLAESYDVLLEDDALDAITADHHTHDPNPPYFDNPRLPVESLAVFHDEQAYGTWTLRICDDDPAADDGVYSRGQIIFRAHSHTDDEHANWHYLLPLRTVDGSDDVTFTYTLYAVDSVGNRTHEPLSVTLRVDNVAPDLTVLNARSSLLITETRAVLSGTVNDGGEVANVYVVVEDPFGNLYEEHATMGADGTWQYHLQPDEPGIYAVHVEAIDRAANVTTVGPFEINVFEPQEIYLPLTSRNYDPGAPIAPDLVVERIVATSDNVQVVVKNQGNAFASEEFWVEVYIDPHPAPTAVNQFWYDLGDEGLFWGVTASALPLEQGDVLTLTVGDEYYSPSHSSFSAPLAAGTPVYAQADAWNADTTYGAVLEGHEILGQAYNNISGPIYSTADAAKWDETRWLFLSWRLKDRHQDE